MTYPHLKIHDERLLKVMQAFVRECALIDDRLDQLDFVPLKGGNSEANLYRFDIEEKAYVLRLLPKGADQSTRKHQISLASLAGKLGIGPEVKFVDAEMDGMISVFIHGRTVLAGDFEKDKALESFAKLLQKLHRSQECFPRAPCPFQRFRRFGESEGITFPSRFIEVKNLMKELESTLNPLAFVPTHLDLHPLNIMISGDHFFLVDWVNGGLSDPFLDLATFAFFQRLSDAQTISFLTHYFERPPTPFEWDRFLLSQPVRLFLIAAALLSTSTDKQRSISYAEALTSEPLPTIEDLEKWHGPLWLYGLTLWKAGLELVDQKNFQSALKNLRETL